MTNRKLFYLGSRKISGRFCTYVRRNQLSCPKPTNKQNNSNAFRVRFGFGPFLIWILSRHTLFLSVFNTRFRDVVFTLFHTGFQWTPSRRWRSKRFRTAPGSWRASDTNVRGCWPDSAPTKWRTSGKWYLASSAPCSPATLSLTPPYDNVLLSVICVVFALSLFYPIFLFLKFSGFSNMNVRKQHVVSVVLFKPTIICKYTNFGSNETKPITRNQSKLERTIREWYTL